MEAKRRKERYGQLESALHQALQDNEAATERRQKEMGSFQQMVATSDGMALLLGVIALAAVGLSLLYLPAVLEQGDTVSIGVLGILLALGVIRAGYFFFGKLRKRRDA